MEKVWDEIRPFVFGILLAICFIGSLLAWAWTESPEYDPLGMLETDFKRFVKVMPWGVMLLCIGGFGVVMYFGLKAHNKQMKNGIALNSINQDRIYRIQYKEDNEWFYGWGRYEGVDNYTTSIICDSGGVIQRDAREVKYLYQITR